MKTLSKTGDKHAITALKENFGDRSAFTLLEMICAMAILFVIIQVCAKMFHQGTVAWATGTRRADMNITGRAIVDFMASEMAQAVADPHLRCYLRHDRTTARFVTLTETNGRSARHVEYTSTGSELHRTVNIPGSPGEYALDPNDWSSAQPQVLAESPSLTQPIFLRFYFTNDASYTTTLPRWIDILLVLPTEEAQAYNNRGYSTRVYFDNYSRSL